MAKSGKKEWLLQQAALTRIKKALEDEKFAAAVTLDQEERSVLKDLQLLTTKPVLYVANVSENAYQDPDVVKKIAAQLHGLVDNPNQIVPISAKIESELAELNESERQTFLKELKVPEGGLDKLIHASYKLLDLITFFAAGEKEAHAWTIKRKTKAPQAAGKIHSDFEKGFIRAEVVSWKDLVENGGYSGAREKGLVRSEGREYVMQDGDVVDVKFKA
jgi:GTP-binding protein YchF